jgi:tetraacyldisaccharide 4'-kinase
VAPPTGVAGLEVLLASGPLERGAVPGATTVWYGAPRRRWAVALLWPLELVFAAMVRLRAALYRAGVKRRIELPVPVIVIGNLTVGGTGKTPLLIWLAARLRERGYSPGVVSRGYGGRAPTWPRRVALGADPREVGDEPVLIAEHTGGPVAVGPDRVAAAELLLSGSAPPVDVLLSDDGLQHYRLARTVEIAVVDGERGLGNGRCLPAGPLREPAARLARVDAVVVNGGDGRINARVLAARRLFGAALAPVGVRRVRDPRVPADFAGRRALADTASHRALADTASHRALADFAGRRVHAVAGIGHPERFFEMLERHGLEVVRHPLPDHAEILPRDLDYGTEPVLVTEKDAVKCRAFAGANVWCVAVDLCFDAGAADALIDLVLERLPAK